MAQKKTNEEEPHRFGWCMDGLHSGCIAQFTSGQTQKDYVCSCDCHKKK